MLEENERVRQATQEPERQENIKKKKQEAAMQKIAATIKAKTGERVEEEKKAPPWSFKKRRHNYEGKTGREDPRLMSERELGQLGKTKDPSKQ